MTERGLALHSAMQTVVAAAMVYADASVGTVKQDVADTNLRLAVFRLRDLLEELEGAR